MTKKLKYYIAIDYSMQVKYPYHTCGVYIKTLDIKSLPFDFINTVMCSANGTHE